MVGDRLCLDVDIIVFVKRTWPITHSECLAGLMKKQKWNEAAEFENKYCIKEQKLTSSDATEMAVCNVMQIATVKRWVASVS